MQFKNPLILALDVDSKDQAVSIFNKVKTQIGAVKIGPRLGYKYGADFINQLSQDCPVFVDNKYFDITSTMLSAIKTSFDAGATLVTVHALSSEQTLKELAKLEIELNQIRPFKILAVTILTSWDQNSFLPNFQNWDLDEHVRSLSETVKTSGLSGIVCSGYELNHISQELFKVVPGLRFGENNSSHDQKRVMSPKQALQNGANALVVGRTVLESNDPQKMVNQILESL